MAGYSRADYPYRCGLLHGAIRMALIELSGKNPEGARAVLSRAEREERRLDELLAKEGRRLDELLSKEFMPEKKADR